MTFISTTHLLPNPIRVAMIANVNVTMSSQDDDMVTTAIISFPLGPYLWTPDTGHGYERK